MTEDHRPMCQCDDCTIAIGKIHALGDAACGRVWTCQCGACRRARKIVVDRAFAKLEDTERKLAHVKAIKEIP